MPAHKLPLTFADFMSVVLSVLWLVQPGVDRVRRNPPPPPPAAHLSYVLVFVQPAVYKWFLENIFGGSHFAIVRLSR
jgi:hypothetical protein